MFPVRINLTDKHIAKHALGPGLSTDLDISIIIGCFVIYWRIK